MRARRQRFAKNITLTIVATMLTQSSVTPTQP